MHILYREQEKSPKIILEIRKREDVEKKVKLGKTAPTETELQIISKLGQKK